MIFSPTEIFLVPVKVLNELRRTALAQLEQEFLEKYKREAPEKILRGEEAKIQPGVRSEDPLGIYASCEKPEQAEVLMNSPEITGLYLPFDVMETCMEQGLQKEKELYLSLPRITRGKMPEEYRKKALTWLSMGNERLSGKKSGSLWNAERRGASEILCGRCVSLYLE